MSNDNPDFEPFMQKGGRLVTTKTASVSMNQHGYVNIPKSVSEQLFDGADYVKYHADKERELLAFEAFADEDAAPANAYKINGGSAPVDKVLMWMGKAPPEEHTMFELQTDGELAYIDVSALPEVEE